MAVAIQHGSFIEDDKQRVVFTAITQVKKLNITLLSHEYFTQAISITYSLRALTVVTDQALNAEIQKGAFWIGYLD